MKHKLSLILIIIYICIACIIHGSGPFSTVNAQNYQCCDSLNPNTTSNDCVCSDQTGGVGACNCSSSPNTRQGWLCKKDANGDSVSIGNKKYQFDSNF